MKYKRIKKYKRVREVRLRDLWRDLALPPVLAVSAWMSAGRFVGAVALAVVTTVLLLCPFAMGLVRLYQAVAPLSLRRRCRFVPSCSAYTLMCLRRFGFFLGVWLGLRRIWRCRPPHGGEDEPPIRLRHTKKYQ